MPTVRTFTVMVTLDDDGNVTETQTAESSRPLTTHEFTPKSRLYPRSCGHCDRVAEHPVHRIC